jgi:hypothetical protein
MNFDRVFLEGYSHDYYVFADGFVRYFDRKGRLKTVRVHHNRRTGLCTVNLRKGLRWRPHLLHGLVASRFVMSPYAFQPGYIVRHIDENIENNCASNLRWVHETD